MSNVNEFTTFHPKLHATAAASSYMASALSREPLHPFGSDYTRHEIEVLTFDFNSIKREDVALAVRNDLTFFLESGKPGTKLTVDISSSPSDSNLNIASSSTTTTTTTTTSVQAEVLSEYPPPILFLHGLASNMSIFCECAKLASSRSHPVAMMSIRGHAGSVLGSLSSHEDLPGMTQFQVAYDVLQVIRFIRSLSLKGWDQPILCVGHSYGANVLVELASMHFCTVFLRGIVCVDGGYINLKRKYGDFESCCRALAPPNLSSFSHASFMHMVRSEWTRGWSEESISSLLRNFVFSTDGSVRARLPLQAHMALLRDLFENPPTFPNIKVPVLLAPAGTGLANAFSRNVRDDVKHATDEMTFSGTPCCVQWFPESSHDIPSQQPKELMKSVFDGMSSGFF
jgi:pimeloyl-ACP methyl ester carboxylesterase